MLAAGFTAVDVLGHGTMGHVIGVGAILSLRVSSTPACNKCVWLSSIHGSFMLLFLAGSWKDLSIDGQLLDFVCMYYSTVIDTF